MLRSKLAFVKRPLVIFDAQNTDHRRWFTDFMRTSAWGHCPVRFEVKEDGELIPNIQRQILEYYAEREFG
jgi:hypothetical protein